MSLARTLPTVFALAACALAAAAAGCTLGPATRSASGPAPAGRTAPPAAGFRTYHNPARGFSITFPADWERKENFRGMVVVAISPQAGPDDTFRENAAVVVEDLPAGTALDVYEKACREKLAASFKDHGYREHESSRTSLAGCDAVRLVYSHRKDDFAMKLITWLVVKGGRGYVICCGSTPAEFDGHLPVFEQIGGSFIAY